MCQSTGLYFVSKGHVQKLSQACESEQQKKKKRIFHHNTTLELLQIMSKSQIPIPAEGKTRTFRTTLAEILSCCTNNFQPGDMTSKLPDRKRPRINTESLQLRGESELRMNPLKETHRRNDKINKLQWCNSAPTWVL